MKIFFKGIIVALILFQRVEIYQHMIKLEEALYFSKRPSGVTIKRPFLFVWTSFQILTAASSYTFGFLNTNFNFRMSDEFIHINPKSHSIHILR